MRPRISVVIVTHNNSGVLDLCLGGVSRQILKPTETIVVDNGSSDGTPDLVRQRYPFADLICLERNHGLTYARNKGASKADGDIVVFLDSDAAPYPDWTKNLLKCCRKSDACASKMLQYRTGRIDNTGGIIQIQRRYHVYPRGWGEEDSGQYDSRASATVDCPCGGAMAIWKNTFEELGGFDEAFNCYYDDPDLGLRLRLSGGMTRYCPGAVVLHLGSATMKSTPEMGRLREYLLIRNRIRMYIKNLSPGEYQRALLLDLVHMVGLFIKMDNRALLYTKALAWNISKILNHEAY